MIRTTKLVGGSMFTKYNISMVSMTNNTFKLPKMYSEWILLAYFIAVIYCDDNRVTNILHNTQSQVCLTTVDVWKPPLLAQQLIYSLTLKLYSSTV